MEFIIEIIGTIAFAISGALIGIQKKMDVLGVTMLGMTTAIGGGIIRDLILGITPPAAFTNPIYAVTSIVVSIIVFIPIVRNIVKKNEKAYTITMRLIDSLGLGIFTVIGTQAALVTIPDCNLFLAVFLGTVTGVGGGVLRDMFANELPYIFVRHFYACASIIGALVFCICYKYLPIAVNEIICTVIVVILRFLAAHYNWQLPKAK